MATIKSYTDLSQSKKLAEILQLESADMHSEAKDINGNMVFIVVSGLGDKTKSNYGSPVWSLAALLDIIPREIFDGEYIINITEGKDYKWIITYDHYENRSHSYYGLSTGADNFVDACVAVIEKLHELKML